VIRVVGPAPAAGSFIASLSMSAVAFRRCTVFPQLRLVAGIPMLTAGMVYLALPLLFVRPSGGCTRALGRFPRNPERLGARSSCRASAADEIGVAERDCPNAARPGSMLE